MIPTLFVVWLVGVVAAVGLHRLRGARRAPQEVALHASLWPVLLLALVAFTVLPGWRVTLRRAR